MTVKQLGLGILVLKKTLDPRTLVDSDTRFLANLSSQLLYYAMYNHNTKKEEVILPNPRCWFYGRDYYYEGLLEIQVPFWTFHARLPPLGHFLPSATLIDWTRPCHPEVSDAACRLVRVVLLMMMLNMEEPTNEGSMHMSRSLIRIIHSYFFNYPWRLDDAYVQYFGIISSEN